MPEGVLIILSLTVVEAVGAEQAYPPHPGCHRSRIDALRRLSSFFWSTEKDPVSMLNRASSGTRLELGFKFRLVELSCLVTLVLRV